MREGVAGLLKHTRIEKGFSLKDAAASTRVPAHYLQILEGEGNPHLLSDALYLVPFLRTYAGFLGLDPAITVAQFVAAIQPNAVLDAPSYSKLGRFPSRIVVVLLILAGLAVAAFFLINGEYRRILWQ
ncbi:MAG: helix-turn-helix domain-containing protein [Candidatus Binatia bacterium]